MKVVILGGAAAMAQPTIKILEKFDKITSLVLADLNVEMVNQIAEELDNEKIDTTSIDITDKDALTNLVTGADLVINFVGPYYKFGTKPLETIIEAGVNYVDILDDYDLTMEVLKLDDKAKEKGVTALVGMGASPGLTNILAKLAADALDNTEEIHTHWVVGETELADSGAMIHMFHIIDGEVPTFKDGKQQLIKAYDPKTSLKVKFEEPIGEVELYHLGHPEPITLPKYIPNVKTVTNRGALIPASQNTFFRIMSEAGMAGVEPVKINGQDIKPIDVLFTVLAEKQAENPNLIETVDEAISSAQVIVNGTKDGKHVSYTFTSTGKGDMASGTSIPTGVAAMQMLAGNVTETGVIAPECLNPVEMVKGLAEIGFLSETAGFKLERKIDDEVEVGFVQDTDKFPELYGNR